MSEQVATPAASVARDPQATANNIVKGITDKANGKAPTASPLANGEQQPSADPSAINPNAGKEKYVADGKEVWLTPEQARAYVQKGISFEPKVTQLGHLQHEVGNFLQTLASDPLKILTDKRIGLTPELVLEKIFQSDGVNDALKEKVGRWYYENVVAPMKMTPEEREFQEAKKKNLEYESREAKARDMAIQVENQRRFELALTQLKSQIGEAMKESGLPSNDTPIGALMARRVADVMRVAYRQQKSVTPKEAISRVKSEFKQIQTAYYDSLDEDKLVEELGEENAKKVQKYFLKLAKQNEKGIPQQKSGPRMSGNKERETLSRDEFFEQLAELKKKG